jgi:RNA-dependent RNA polymerase
MLGAGCEYGEDTSERRGDGISYLAFDFTMEVIAIRARLMLQQDKLPPALRPLEAEIAFDDICSRGISIIEEPSDKLVDGQKAWQVTVTLSCKRPARFFIEFEHANQLPSRGERVPRRRATAIDFAMSRNRTVSLYISIAVCLSLTSTRPRCTRDPSKLYRLVR